MLDVTDPRAPRLLTQTRLPHGGVRSNSLAVGDGLLLVAYQVHEPGQQPAGIEVFDLSRPAEPRLAGRLDLSGPRSRRTHWVGSTGGRYVYLSTGTPDSRPHNPRDDATDERAPLIIGSLPLPPVAGYAARGGRFGPHNLHENEPFGWSWQSEEIIFGAFFSAGCARSTSATRSGRGRSPRSSRPGRCRPNDVYVTADGIVYAVDRDGGGLYILKYSGPG